MLVAAVVGSGVMATSLTDDQGLALLVNAVSTVLALGVLIALLAPVSGAHINPAVTLVLSLRREIAPQEAVGYVAAQLLGALGGVALANVMFSLPAWELATTERSGGGQWLGEVVATAGLVWVIVTLVRNARANLVPVLVPAWIGGAYFFTSSTSFANPAVTVGRTFSDTFTGIEPSSTVPFVLAQVVGGVVGLGLALLFQPDTSDGQTATGHTEPEVVDLTEGRP
jgi:glycerol uptake facilitator-like aquaporin